MEVINNDICYGKINKTTNLENIITSRIIPDLRDIFAKWIGHWIPQISFRIPKREFPEMRL